MKIRSLSWGAADISWSVVLEQLLRAAENRGHQVDFISTNGTAGMRYWDDARVMQSLVHERDMVKTNTPYDIDLTFTVPSNYPQRFLRTSKTKLAITDYESWPAPSNWKRWCNVPDQILVGSTWVGDAMIASGCPAQKITVVPHGVDLELFNPSVQPYPIKTEKKFKFLCIAEPHYRKQIDVLLDLYCSTFTSDDDVCLVLKTRLFKNNESRHPFEQDLRPILAKVVRKFGAKIPEIKVITTRIPDIAGLYTACQAFVLMTAAEGFGVPFLEALACGVPVIAPKFGGQIDFLNDKNSILCTTPPRPARLMEQYWGQEPNSTVGNPSREEFASAMVHMVKNYNSIKEQMLPNMIKTAQEHSWDKIWDKVSAIANGESSV